MLILSRKRNEQICINGQLVTITVVDIRGDKVRIGIDAPKEVSVHRREVYDAIAEKNKTENFQPQTNEVSQPC